MRHNKLKRKLRQGGTGIGVFITVNSTDIVEIAALSGFDFVVLDMEHGTASVESTKPLVLAAELHGITPVTRVTDGSQGCIMRSLDAGSQGIQVPQVGNRQMAENAVKFTKYYPEGERGMGSPRAGGFGSDPMDEYLKEANEESLIVLQCESVEGLNQLDEIAGVPQVDVIFLGPYDMSQSMGIPGQVNSPRILEARQKVLEVSEKYGIAAGTFAESGAKAKELEKMGFRYITIGMDVDHILEKMKEEVCRFAG